MPNMARTLLRNVSGQDNQSAGAFAEYVAPYYREVSLPSGLLTVRRALFGGDPDQDGLDLSVWRYMRIIHSTEYEDWALALDPRLTYTGLESKLDVAFGTTVSADEDAFQFVGSTGLGGADGRLGASWRIDQLALAVYTITDLRTQQYVTHSVGLHDGMTEFMAFPGRPDFLVRIQTQLLTETSWSVSHVEAPGPAMDPVNRAAQASNIGVEAYNELFPSRDPFKLFKQLWEQHSLFPYKMSGYLLALIYRTEEIRSGAG
jgi:hypothetical protein